MAFTVVDHFTTLPVLITGLFYSIKEEHSTMGKRAPRRSIEEWRQIILEARASGVSDYEYCRNKGIASSSFYRALSVLRHQACELPERSVRSEDEHEIVPINISELPIGRDEQMLDAAIPASFEATMRITLGGSTLELTNHADTAMIASVLKMLTHPC